MTMMLKWRLTWLKWRLTSATSSTPNSTLDNVGGVAKNLGHMFFEEVADDEPITRDILNTKRTILRSQYPQFAHHNVILDQLTMK
ncbi:hypothetical protein M5689_020448 [Euphorbia peplus]|nr:hypothetical protein M5689_020448 [Euphorbia peplus]